MELSLPVTWQGISMSGELFQMVDNFIDNGTMLDYFKKQWSTRQLGPVLHSPEVWDERALDWIAALKPKDGVETTRAMGMKSRVASTAGYLRQRGLLGSEERVVDVGCGPGLFVLEFAKTAKSATGIDYSQTFVDFGTSEAKANGIANVRFLQRDFFALDVEKEGHLREYDLVFSSITPAATGEGCLDKLMSMSKRWCYNASFVHASDTMSEQVCRDVFNDEFIARWSGKGFYTLLNLLWLSGFYPETSYFDDVREEVVEPSWRWAEKIASYCGRRGEEDIQKVLRYLEKRSDLYRRSEFRYGSILWNVNRKDRR